MFQSACTPAMPDIIGEHSIWTYPFTPPSTTVINTHDNTRQWSKSTYVASIMNHARSNTV